MNDNSKTELLGEEKNAAGVGVATKSIFESSRNKMQGPCAFYECSILQQFLSENSNSNNYFRNFLPE
jgi:hypothetical protein